MDGSYPFARVCIALVACVSLALVPGLIRPAAEGVADPPPPRLTHETSFVVFPADANANYPMLFGGKTLAEMDRCAGVTVRRLLYSSTVRDAVTVGIDGLRFVKAAEVKDLLFVSGEVKSLGEKSVKVFVRVSREAADGTRETVAEGDFSFVAYDRDAKKAVPHGLKMPGR